MKRQDVLERIAWGTKWFGSIVTSRLLRRRDVLRCVRAGLAESIGVVVLCDPDGFIMMPERYREGFRLARAGRRAVEKAGLTTTTASGMVASIPKARKENDA